VQPLDCSADVLVQGGRYYWSYSADAASQEDASCVARAEKATDACSFFAVPRQARGGARQIDLFAVLTITERDVVAVSVRVWVLDGGPAVDGACTKEG